MDDAPAPISKPGTGWQLTVIALLGIVAAVTYLGPILKPLFTAVFVFFLIRPAADWLKRRGLSALFAYLVLFVAASGAVVGLLAVLASNAVRFQQDWPVYRQRLLDMATQRGWEHRIGEAMSLVTPESVIGTVVAPAASAAEFGMMFVFYLLFLILSAPKFPERVRRSLPGERSDTLLRVGTAVSDGMSKYMEVKTGINAGLALTVGVVLAGFGIDYWLLWAVLIFALNYVTYIGAVVALVPPVLLGFVQLPLVPAFVLLGVLFVVRFVWIDILEVRLSGKHLNIDSIFLLIFMAYWGWVWGLIGLVLAMPMATCIRAALAAVEKTRPLAGLMSED